MQGFFDAFAPNFAASAAGVFLALVIDRWIDSRRHQRIERRNRQLVRDAIQALKRDIEWNQVKLEDLQRALQSPNGLTNDHELMFGGWQVAQQRLIEHLPDPTTLSNIARYFD